MTAATARPGDTVILLDSDFLRAEGREDLIGARAEVNGWAKDAPGAELMMPLLGIPEDTITVRIPGDRDPMWNSEWGMALPQSEVQVVAGEVAA